MKFIRVFVISCILVSGSAVAETGSITDPVLDDYETLSGLIEPVEKEALEDLLIESQLDDIIVDVGGEIVDDEFSPEESEGEVVGADYVEDAEEIIPTGGKVLTLHDAILQQAAYVKDKLPAGCVIHSAIFKAYHCGGIHEYAGAVVEYTCKNKSAGWFQMPTTTYPACCAGGGCTKEDMTHFQKCLQGYPPIKKDCGCTYKWKASKPNKAYGAMVNWNRAVKAESSLLSTTVDFGLTIFIEGDPRPCAKWARDVIDRLRDKYAD